MLSRGNLTTRDHAVRGKFQTASQSDHALAHTPILQLMPKLKRGSGGVKARRSGKQGTKNVHQAAARDKRAADADLFADFEYAMKQNLAYTYWLPHDHKDKFLAGTAEQVQRLMELTWAHDGAVRSERIVEDICRFPAALQAIITANGAKVEHLDNRQGRRKSKRAYVPPRIEAVEELLKAKFERLDPTPVAPDTLPPKKRRRK